MDSDDTENSETIRGLIRLARAEKDMDERTTAVLAYHLALEREVMIVLGRLLPSATPVVDLPFAHKISLLESLWTLGGHRELAAALRRYNDLRNALAHGDLKEEIDVKQAKLERSCGRLSGHQIAWGIRGAAALLIGYLNSPADDELDLTQG